MRIEGDRCPYCNCGQFEKVQAHTEAKFGDYTLLCPNCQYQEGGMTEEMLVVRDLLTINTINRTLLALTQRTNSTEYERVWAQAFHFPA